MLQHFACIFTRSTIFVMLLSIYSFLPPATILFCSKLKFSIFANIFHELEFCRYNVHQNSIVFFPRIQLRLQHTIFVLPCLDIENCVGILQYNKMQTDYTQSANQHYQHNHICENVMQQYSVVFFFNLYVHRLDHLICSHITSLSLEEN